jgi:NADPH:quinone reductase-like Zn-dependent oxidoreductase
MVSMGLVADTVLGADAAGTITHVGSKVTMVKPGDRVALMSIGAYRNILRANETLVQILPDAMTFEEGASLPCVYITAYQSLVEIGRLSHGESILIHSAAGGECPNLLIGLHVRLTRSLGLGQAAIQLAKHLGAEVFVTAGSPEKRKLLMDEHGIPNDHVFNSRDTTFAKGIMRMTNGKGVDVVLNSLAGEALRRTWECIADYGRFIEVGKKDILGNSGLEMMPFLRNVTFAGVNIEVSLFTLSTHDMTY